MSEQKKLVFAVDFDGTLFTTRWPQIISPIMNVIDFCLTQQQAGHYLILWTCREGKELDDAVAACKQYELVFDAVNENLPHRIQQFGTDPRKVGADYYIDDKSIQPSLIYLQFASELIEN